VPPAVVLLNYMRSGFFSLGFFTGFSINIINFAGTISEAVMGGAGDAQHSVLRVKEHKKSGVRSTRARTCGKNPLVRAIFLQCKKNAK
jgi:hypothetical protein